MLPIMQSIRIAVSLVLLWSAVAIAAPDPIPAAAYQALRWRMVGPFRGGRTHAAAGPAAPAAARAQAAHRPSAA